jgi:hypothetical protein
VRVERARFVVVRDCEVSGGSGGAAVVFHEGATDVAFLGNKVHHYVWGERDSHGVLVLPDTARILIQGNESWANSGDSFQCQGPDTAQGSYLPVDITVEDNRFHEDEENAIDIKTCERVTVRDNVLYGYRPKPSSPQGAAMVVHYSARRILLEGNHIWDSGRGLSLGGVQRWGQPVTDVIVRRNLVVDGSTERGGPGDGLRLGTSRRVRLYNNTLAFLPKAGIRVEQGSHGGAEDVQVSNNIVYATPFALEVELRGARHFSSDANLFFLPGGSPLLSLDGQPMSLEEWRAASGQDLSSQVADPLFFPAPRASGFFTRPGSPARDKALPREGLPPICGAGPDLGSFESCL